MRPRGAPGTPLPETALQPRACSRPSCARAAASHELAGPAPATALLTGIALAVLLLAGPTAAVLPRPVPKAAQATQQAPVKGLLGAEVNDIAWSGRYLWVATDRGLARLDPEEASGLAEADWVTFTEANGLSRGGLSALAAGGETVWVASVFDTTIAGLSPPERQVNGGLSYSRDGGATWQRVPNAALFDTSRATFWRGPTTAIDNGCFGLAVDGQTVWATFFAGSSVRSRDHGRTWERILPDGAPDIVYFVQETGADSLQALADSLEQAGGSAAQIARLQAGADSLQAQAALHRTFAVLAYGDTVWIGTAGGITHSFDNGRTWRIARVRLGVDGRPLPGNPSANWAVSLERQVLPDGASVIWAGTQSTGLTGEANGISWTRDQGRTWQSSGPTSAWDFAFTASRVWASTNEGLRSSADQGRTWDVVVVEDPVVREQLRGVFVGLETVGQTLWVGAENGLGRSTDEGQTWRIAKSPLRTVSLDTGKAVGEGGLVDPDSVRTYAAPSPFAPAQGEQTRIYYSLEHATRVDIDIFDFASRRVRTLISREDRAAEQNHGDNWDGRDDQGGAVANGVYFYRIELGDGRQAFGKVVVLD